MIEAIKSWLAPREHFPAVLMFGCSGGIALCTRLKAKPAYPHGARYSIRLFKIQRGAMSFVKPTLRFTCFIDSSLAVQGASPKLVFMLRRVMSCILGAPAGIDTVLTGLIQQKSLQSGYAIAIGHGQYINTLGSSILRMSKFAHVGEAVETSAAIVQLCTANNVQASGLMETEVFANAVAEELALATQKINSTRQRSEQYRRELSLGRYQDLLFRVRRNNTTVVLGELKELSRLAIRAGLPEWKAGNHYIEREIKIAKFAAQEYPQINKTWTYLLTGASIIKIIRFTTMPKGSGEPSIAALAAEMEAQLPGFSQQEIIMELRQLITPNLHSQ